LALVAGALGLYVAGFVALFPWVGRSAIGFGILPIIVAGVSFGLRLGLPIGVLAIPTNLMMLRLVGGLEPSDVWGANSWMAHIVFLLVAAVAGMMSDLWRRLQRELETRRAAEAQLEFMARHDPLTGLFNRYSLDEILDRELARARRYQRPIGFLMIDVNRFKEVNDRFGHQMGDRVLRGVANLLAQETRQSDFVFRYGGDEFLVVLPETNGETVVVLERIRAEVQRRNETNPLLEFPVTLAIGAIHQTGREEESADEILAELDRRMYEDKRSTS